MSTDAADASNAARLSAANDSFLTTSARSRHAGFRHASRDGAFACRLRAIQASATSSSGRRGMPTLQPSLASSPASDLGPCGQARNLPQYKRQGGQGGDDAQAEDSSTTSSSDSGRSNNTVQDYSPVASGPPYISPSTISGNSSGNSAIASDWV